MGRMNDLSVLLIVTVAFLVAGCAEEEKEVTSITDKGGFNHLEGYLAASPEIEGDFIFVATGSGAVRKLNKTSGRIEWTFEEVGGFVNNSPVIAGDSILAMGSEGKLVAIDKISGEKKWEKASTEWTLEGEEIDSPNVAGCMGYCPQNKLLIIGDDEGHVLALEMDKGNVKWHRDLTVRIVAPPLFDGDTVYISSLSGRIHALNLSDGSDRWELPKVLVSEVMGSIPDKEDEVEILGSGYTLTLKYKYNFHPDDYFGHGEKAESGNIEFVLLDDEGKPVKCIIDNEEKESIEVKGLDPGGHLGSGSQTEEKVLILAKQPGTLKGWPLTVLVKDNQGKEIDKLSTKVTFESAEKVEKEPEA